MLCITTSFWVLRASKKLVETLLTRRCASTIGAALLCRSGAGSDLGLESMRLYSQFLRLSTARVCDTRFKKSLTLFL